MAMILEHLAILRQTLVTGIRKRKQLLVSISVFLLTLASFITALSILYYRDPASFEATWKGRTYYLFFTWLFILEAILSWEELKPKITKLKSIRTIAFAVALILPTVYMVIANYYGLNTLIQQLSTQYSVGMPQWMPLSTEYLVFAVLFAFIIFLHYGTDGMNNFSITTVFLGAMGLIYIINDLYPYGKFAPFQMIVPTTASLAASTLRLMGYHTLFLGDPMGLPTYIAWDNQNNYSGAFAIAWPCSGVESLIIYSIVILLFVKKSNISWVARTVYFVIGALITYFINVLRIATIFIISINGGNVSQFHDYYGQLYSITWIISYPLIIIGIQALSRKFSLGNRLHVSLQAIKRIKPRSS
jgi:thaumarchaeosortase